MIDPNLTETLIGAVAFERVVEALAEEIAPGTGTTSIPELGVASTVAAASALRRTDDGQGDLYSQRIGPTSVALLFGVDPETLLHQRMGTGGAPAQGRDPGAFPTDFERGLMAPVDRPGKGIQVIAGAALAFRLREEPRVALFVDDVAGTASGDWHEGLNFAAVSKAPLVVLLHTRPGANQPHSALQRLRDKAPAYGVRAASASAADPMGIAHTVSEAVEAAREGAGTILIEVEHPRHAESPSESPGGLASGLGMMRSELEARIVSRVEEFAPMAARAREAAAASSESSRNPGSTTAVDAPTPWYRSEDPVPR